MKIRLLAVGRKMPRWVADGFAEYARRMPRESPLELIEIPPAKRPAGEDAPAARAAEAEQIRRRLGRDEHLIALDERGQAIDTRRLADWYGDWLMGGRDVALVVGGADGLDPELLAAAGQRWSLSPLTLPHGLVRVIVAEQLYRAWSLRSGHPYHRA